MAEHPINSLMETAMNNIQDMIDVNTIIGEPIEISNETVIIPVSKVSFGFAAGGSEFKGKKEKDEKEINRLPFGGGSGAGVSINPIAFLTVQKNNVKLMPINHSSSVDKLIDYLPEVMEKVNNMLNKYIQNKEENTKKKINQINKNKEEVKEVETEIKEKPQEREIKTKWQRR